MRALECRGPNCKQLIVFLINTDTGKSVPVDYSSLTMDEKKGMESGVNVLYNKVHHIIHYKTCPDRDRFHKSGGKRNKFGSTGNKL